ncbi:DUF4246 domain-containing protein [Nocardia camponoti]|uniref:DUF4246 family protein n=1 Tax=Nocardia camponoti TaxID=1616106 RepID=A0A917QB04_9NOCA|nr:DUF4246 domain-containing protein [Nocardia camponoti]GGK40354.1 hypothetical protein GCM10011591_10030 [Nocardia camponoti]
MTELAPFPLPFRVDYLVAVAPPKTVRELEMTRLSAGIRSKPQWHEKMLDAGIVARWSREASEQGATDDQIAFVLAELGYYALRRDAATGIEVAAVDGVWQSDSLIGDELRDRLRAAVAVLEDVPAAEEDWHPGSKGQVLDLVHPSLYCRVRGVSQPESAPWPQLAEDEATYALSPKFQWLPTDVDVDVEGGPVFLSYVNNVDPARHHALDKLLPEVFTKVLPLFSNVLGDLQHPRPPRIEVDPWSWYGDSEPQEPEDDDEEGTLYEAYEAAWDEWWANRRPAQPDAPEFVMPELPIPVALNGRRLQVIVKLANIHLTPDNPEYPGGSWHVEAMLNERIVSTAIYYWNSSNITESKLGFRAAIDDPAYQQSDTNGVRDIFGLNDEDPLNQELGSVRTPEGRCIAFPNIYQHRVAPFRLADEARPGHRKILAFFLVDPTVTITSTSDIPPQQPWAPTSTMSRAQAMEFREQLMHERKYFVDEHNDDIYEREFSLCEH